MAQQEKQKLFAALCGYWPYKLLGRDAFGKTREMKVIYPSGTIIAQEIDSENCAACGFVPYLRPMSSMTGEETEELSQLIQDHHDDYSGWQYLNLCDGYKYYDWLNKKKFDYRGLIPMGLALEAPEGMYEIAPASTQLNKNMDVT